MGKYKGSVARYNVLSVRVDDMMLSQVKIIVPRGKSISDLLHDLLERECAAYFDECERAAIEYGRNLV